MNTKQPAWEIANLRLTVFQPTKINWNEADSWWEEIFTDAPDEANESYKTATMRLTGEWRERRLSLVVSQNRADWNLVPAQTGEPGLASIGAWPEEGRQWFNAFGAWLSTQKIQRLALGVTLFVRVSNSEEALALLESKISSLRFSEKNIHDFMFVINRPRRSTLQNDISNNRLQKWGISTASYVQILLQGKPITMELPKQVACSLELDLNTSAEFLGLLEAPEKHLHELMALAEEIALHGDVS